jgi:hypothetical protein
MKVILDSILPTGGLSSLKKIVFVCQQVGHPVLKPVFVCVQASVLQVFFSENWFQNHFKLLKKLLIS